MDIPKGHATVNINGPMSNILEQVTNNYNTVVSLVAIYMAISAAQSQEQAQEGTFFNQCEHSGTPISNPENWGNNVWELTPKDQGGGGGDASIYGPKYTDDNTSFNALMQQFSALISQINQITNQNTQAEGTTTGVGTAITNYQQGFTRLITF